MNYQINKIIGLSLFVISFISCTHGRFNASETIFPNTPDTTNFVELASFLDFEKQAYIISEQTTLRNGKVRSKGIVAAPAYGDDFRGNTLDNVYWQGVSILEGDFRGNSFHSSNCTKGDFSYSDFRVGAMKWTLFDHSKLVGCNFNQAEMLYVIANETIMDSSTFKGVNMFGMEGFRASFRACDFSYSLMKETEFIETDFTACIALKANFIRAVLVDAKIDSSDLCYSNFSAASLEGTTFKRSRLIGVNFNDANLKGVDFSGADLKDCKFIGAEFENTIFSDAVNIPKNIEKVMVDDQITGIFFGNKINIKDTL